MENWQQRSINLENQLHYANTRIASLEEQASKDAATIAALDAALKVAEEALEELTHYLPPGKHQNGSANALAAIREARPSRPQGCAATDQREGV